MNISQTILWKSLVKPFYKQNAGLFAFLIFFMVAAVGRANDVGLLEYHLSLIQGMMTNGPFLLFVLFAWFLYAFKCAQFVLNTMGRKDYGFLSLLSLKKSREIRRMMTGVQCFLLLPILSYAIIAIWVGIVHHWWPHVMIIVFFFFLLILLGPVWYDSAVRHPGRAPFLILRFRVLGKFTSYWLLLIRYLGSSRKLLFAAIKISSCLILYGLVFGQRVDRAGLQMIILFYSIGLLGHGVLVYTIRATEESTLSFYRGLPVSLFRRFLQYALFYLLLFIPEIIVIEWLTPTYLGYADALLFILFGYSVLLFLNSILFIRFFPKFDYLKIVTGLFLFIFMAVLTHSFPAFCLLLFLLSVYIFFRYYYRFEKI
jgi:hypothetical protein